MEIRIQAVIDKWNAISASNCPRVYYEVANEPYTTVTSATMIGELLNLAGADNIFADLDGTYPEVSAEQITTLDSHAILGPRSHADQLTPEALADRPGWDVISAVQSGRCM